MGISKENEVSDPRPMSIVELTEEWREDAEKHNDPSAKESHFLYLGEIANMPGHCAAIGQPSGMSYVGFHTERYKETE